MWKTFLIANFQALNPYPACGKGCGKAVEKLWKTLETDLFHRFSTSFPQDPCGKSDQGTCDPVEKLIWGCGKPVEKVIELDQQIRFSTGFSTSFPQGLWKTN